MNKLKQLVEQICDTLSAGIHCFISIILYLLICLPILLPLLFIFVVIVVLLSPILLISIPFIIWKPMFNKSTDKQEIMSDSEND